MRTISSKFLLSLVAVLSLIFSAQAQSDAAERAKLEGTWVGGVTNPGVQGKSGQGTMVILSEVVIKDGKITAKDGGKSGLGEGTYKLNLGTNPKTLDAVGTGGKTQGKNYLGIYKLNGDSLEWCAGNPAIPRPTAFFTKPQVQFHMVLTRKKG